MLARAKCPEQYSSYLCFVYATKGQCFSYPMLSKWFNLLVDKNEYSQNERKGIMDHLYRLSNNAEEKDFCLKNRLQDILNNSYGFCWAK